MTKIFQILHLKYKSSNSNKKLYQNRFVFQLYVNEIFTICKRKSMQVLTPPTVATIIIDVRNPNNNIWDCRFEVLFFTNTEVIESFKVALYEACILEWAEWLTISIVRIETNYGWFIKKNDLFIWEKCINNWFYNFYTNIEGASVRFIDLPTWVIFLHLPFANLRVCVVEFSMHC